MVVAAMVVVTEGEVERAMRGGVGVDLAFLRWLATLLIVIWAVLKLAVVPGESSVSFVSSPLLLLGTRGRCKECRLLRQEPVVVGRRDVVER
jgi:hypothetical protein